MRICTILTVWALSIGPACAQIPALCSEQRTQLEMNDCAEKLLAEADAKLNTLYAQLMAKVDSTAKDSTREAQRAWLVFRDKECVSRTGGGPDQRGTIWPALYMECQIGLTRVRIDDLGAQIKCRGGDLSCTP